MRVYRNIVFPSCNMKLRDDPGDDGAFTRCHGGHEWRRTHATVYRILVVGGWVPWVRASDPGPDQYFDCGWRKMVQWLWTEAFGIHKSIINEYFFDGAKSGQMNVWRVTKYDYMWHLCAHVAMKSDMVHPRASRPSTGLPRAGAKRFVRREVVDKRN